MRFWREKLATQKWCRDRHGLRCVELNKLLIAPLGIASYLGIEGQLSEIAMEQSAIATPLMRTPMVFVL